MDGTLDSSFGEYFVATDDGTIFQSTETREVAVRACTTIREERDSTADVYNCREAVPKQDGITKYLYFVIEGDDNVSDGTVRIQSRPVERLADASFAEKAPVRFSNIETGESHTEVLAALGLATFADTEEYLAKVDELMYDRITKLPDDMLEATGINPEEDIGTESNNS